MTTRTLDRLRDTAGKLPAYAWPGGYPVLYVLADGAVLCPACANGANGSEAADTAETDAQWRLEGHDVNWEDPDCYCDHCGARIESAYAERD